MDSLSSEFIKDRLSSPWDLGNDVLYKLCADHPLHGDPQAILAKTMFIGRIYAAAIERRRKTPEGLAGGDDFYTGPIVDTFKRGGLDKHLRKLSGLNAGAAFEILEAHKALVDMLHGITGLEKRSFASKYLHFHFREMFFIYDSRAVKELKGYVRKVPKEYGHLLDPGRVDVEYAKFFCKCLHLQGIARSRYKGSPMEITPRVIDNILIR